MPTAMTNSKRAQDQRSVRKVAYQAVGLEKTERKAKKLTCLTIWRMTMRILMRMK